VLVIHELSKPQKPSSKSVSIAQKNNSERKLTRAQRKKRRRELTQTQWASEQDPTETEVCLADRIASFHRFGDFSLSWSTVVQPLLSHDGDADGYIAWRKRWGQTVALGDPLCSSDQLTDRLKQIIERRSGISFCQISDSTARALSDLGYVVNQMGIDTTLPLDQYTCAGKEKEWLRYASNWTRKRGYEVREQSMDQVTPAAIVELSEAWRMTRTVKRKEVRFLNRPIVLVDEPDVRKFFLYDPENKLQAFVFLDPLYRDGKITGYVTSFKRRDPSSSMYAEQAIMKHIIDTLKAEGVSKLMLGLSPMAEIEEGPFRESSTRRWMFGRTYNSRIINRHFYNLQGHADYKRRFRGANEKVWFASPPGVNPRRIPALIALCGIA